MVQFFRVGGWVRDQLLCMPSKDNDYVVVGATQQWMLDNGFEQVGAAFPVFLKDGDEYALARTERKTGPGYTGFECFTENVTLEQDLGRRDLTINAMAMTTDGKVVDPYGGRHDLRHKLLRHVNAEAFREDPVRVLRLARFLARWPDFNVDGDTWKLCEEMVKSGELNHLTTERVTKEMLTALGEKSPTRFFIFLQSVGALEVVFPEVAALYGVPQPFKWHPEGCAFTHTMLVLDAASKLDVEERTYLRKSETWADAKMTDHEARQLLNWCALVHDLGKATTPADILPSHHGHEDRGERILQKVCDRMKMPNMFRDVAAVVCRYHTHVHNMFKLNVKTLAHMYKDNRVVFGDPERTWVFVATSWADTHGRGPFNDNLPYPNSLCMHEVMEGMRDLKARDFLPGEVLKDPKMVNVIIQTMFNERRRVANQVRNKFLDQLS